MANQKTHWQRKLDAAIKRKFGVKTKTFFDLIGSMRYITYRTDGKPLTGKITAFINKWMEENVSATPTTGEN